MSDIPQQPGPPSVALTYSIFHSTPHSGRYRPENVIVDKPVDQSSRWSGAYQGNANQWIILRLDSLAILTSITFGKFGKPHPCNMKEFKVLVGLDEDHMKEVLHSGLKNDIVPETFPIRHTNSMGVDFPTRFVKIIPICAHGQSFHVSIWHVAMAGIVDPLYVEKTRTNHEEYRETAVLRHILKHLRQRRLLTPYQAILSRTNLQFEHPLITKLHESIVLEGDWSRAERLLQGLSAAGLFSSYLHSCQPRAEWTRLYGTDADGDIPPARGGHATCMDPVNDMIYLFGGWDGEKDLDDFWVYSIKDDRWRVLSHSTSHEQNAPGARSCHKMVFDTKTGSIYLLGRLNDSDGLRPASATPTPMTGEPPRQTATPPSSTGDGPNTPTAKTYCSEFYRYHTRGVDTGKWDFLSFDTATSGGPPLIFDHQMVMDCDAQILYVFGGRVVDGEWDSYKYSGLYSYNVRLSKWRLLQHPNTPTGTQVIIPSRFGHSMVFEPETKTLYIFAGQRENKYLSDMYAYDISTNNATELFSNFTAAGGPDACFTQRAVIDHNLKEIYVFCGLTRNSPAGAHNTLLYMYNWVYRYDTKPGQWTRIICDCESTSAGRADVPMPRFAHQVVYNPKTRTAYMHGGNAEGFSVFGRSNFNSGNAKDADGDGVTEKDDIPKEFSDGKEKRLDDFWKMELRRPSAEEIIRRAAFRLRGQQFREMCEDATPVEALHFLQNKVSSVVNHADIQEETVFRSLLTHLLAPAKPSQPAVTLPSVRSSISPTDSSTSLKASMKQDDTRYDSTRPKKRSRPNTPDSQGDGNWTNRISDEEEDSSSSETHSRTGNAMHVSMQALRGIIDPMELDEDVGNDITKKHLSGLSSTRYGERTEVFEGLLEFFADNEKQPSGSLLDLVDQSGILGNERPGHVV